jgi:hypothetical protein
MEVKLNFRKIMNTLLGMFSAFKKMFIKENTFSEKIEMNFGAFKVMAFIGVLIFIGVVFLLPNEESIQFTEKIDSKREQNSKTDSNIHSKSTNKESAQSLWSSPSGHASSISSVNQVNHNTSMILGSKNGNAKTELRAGIRLPLKILDKVTVSQEPVPILAELILDSQTESGLKLPAGTKLYGEASSQKGTERVSIKFMQLSLPSGQIKRISAVALSKDGQPGVIGRVFSDGMKNSAGQLLTTFVGGLAAGSMESDILGKSKGGIENGLLGAIAATAQSKAQSYGEKLKTEREWIELKSGTECDAVLNESVRLQEGGDSYE